MYLVAPQIPRVPPKVILAEEIEAGQDLSRRVMLEYKDVLYLARTSSMFILLRVHVTAGLVSRSKGKNPFKVIWPEGK